MRVYEITFSPTGGTQKVADLFAKAFSGERIPLDLTDSAFDFKSCMFTAEDLCIVAVPSYGGRVPQTAVSRLKQMTGGNAKAVLLAVYGNRAYEDTLLELYDTLSESGFRCVAAVAAVAEHSIMRQFASGRPDSHDGEILKSYGEKIQESLNGGKEFLELSVPGNRPYREYGGSLMKPKAGNACIECGLCAKKCPVGAIPKENPKETDKEKCISCMRCVALCPNKARSVDEALLTATTERLQKVCSQRKENQLFLPRDDSPARK